VLDHLSAASVLLASGATEIRTNAKQLHVPRVTGDTAVGWYSELDPITEADVPGDELVLTPRKVATLVRLSNESVKDSSPQVLDVAGTNMVRSVAKEADRAMFAGTGPANDQPTGILTLPGLPNFDGPPDYTGLVSASGMVRAAGGNPNVAYVNPTDYTTLQLATGADDRPLLGDPTAGAPPVIAGLTVWPTPAVPTGTALVAQADQIVVAVREDASVAVSEHAAFGADGTLARVIARLDVGVNDLDGLATVKDVVAREAGSKRK
jgi:HK97 family phage major capsid protein